MKTRTQVFICITALGLSVVLGLVLYLFTHMHDLLYVVPLILLLIMFLIYNSYKISDLKLGQKEKVTKKDYKDKKDKNKIMARLFLFLMLAEALAVGIGFILYSCNI